MRKLIFLIFVLTFLFAPKDVLAYFATVKQDGSVVWHVLGASRESLRVTATKASSNPPSDGLISIANEDGKVNLTVKTASGETKTDVSEFSDEIIEIEERDAVKKVAISTFNEYFLIKQNDIIAQTIFPIFVDPKKKEISVETNTGIKHLSIFPNEVVAQAINNGFIDELTEPDKKIYINEDSDNTVRYNLSGEKKINLFNLVSLKVPITVSISAADGKLLEINKPKWFEILGFLFT